MTLTRRNFHIPDHDYAALEALAEAQGEPVAALVRAAIRELLERERPPKKSRKKSG